MEDDGTKECEVRSRIDPRSLGRFEEAISLCNLTGYGFEESRQASAAWSRLDFGSIFS